MGTELGRRGANIRLPLWSANALIERPALVQAIHEEYIAAGAQMITTNTFRTTTRTFALAGLLDRSEELTMLAVHLAKNARAKYPDCVVRIAGSMAPLEDCYRPDLVPPDDDLAAEHALHADRLARAGVDYLLCETMGTAREADAAAEAAAKTGLPFIVSFLCDADGNLYDGTPLEEAVDRIEQYKPWSFSLNCISPRNADAPLERLRSSTFTPFGIYANVGKPGAERDETWEIDIGPEEYGKFARHWGERGALFVGGCCGTTPDYIRELRKVFA